MVWDKQWEFLFSGLTVGTAYAITHCNISSK